MRVDSFQGAFLSYAQPLLRYSDIHITRSHLRLHKRYNEDCSQQKTEQPSAELSTIAASDSLSKPT